MANANTVAAVYNLSQGNVTTETAFAGLSPIGGSSAAFGAGTTRAVVEVKPDVATGLFDGRPFRVRAAAKAASNGATNFTLKVYWNSGVNTNLTTFTGGDILLATSGITALASKPGSLWISALCIWDAASQQLAAVSEATLSNVVTTPIIVPAANVTATIGGVVLTTQNPVATAVTTTASLQFFATALFGTTQTGNAVTLTELAIDQI